MRHFRWLCCILIPGVRPTFSWPDSKHLSDKSSGAFEFRIARKVFFKGLSYPFWSVGTERGCKSFNLATLYNEETKLFEMPKEKI
jgi:hypothetical protein